MIAAESVEKTLERVRPYLREDGGDVELVRVTEDGIVEVRLTGSCVSCPLSIMTVRAGIERALMIDHSEIRRVEQVR
jgi:Fe-S cluster biogenesis protein NfuA